jgi:hypothetical protein
MWLLAICTGGTDKDSPWSGNSSWPCPLSGKEEDRLVHFSVCADRTFFAKLRMARAWWQRAIFCCCGYFLERQENAMKRRPGGMALKNG